MYVSNLVSADKSGEIDPLNNSLIGHALFCLYLNYHSLTLIVISHPFSLFQSLRFSKLRCCPYRCALSVVGSAKVLCCHLNFGNCRASIFLCKVSVNSRCEKGTASGACLKIFSKKFGAGLPIPNFFSGQGEKILVIPCLEGLRFPLLFARKN